MDINTYYNGNEYILASNNGINVNSNYISHWLMDKIPLTNNNKLAFRKSTPILKVWLNGSEWFPARYAWFPDNVIFNYSQTKRPGNRSGKWVNGDFSYWDWRKYYTTGIHDGYDGHLHAHLSRQGTTASGVHGDIYDNSLGVNVSMNMGANYASSYVSKTVTQEDQIIFTGGSWPTRYAEFYYININNVSTTLNGYTISRIWQNDLGENKKFRFMATYES